ncbi:MAG: dihydrolipoyl dehydrogenase [Paludibacteraceae bacterium]|nr:dihydrolipoyl dehydrogenase [Paludibacteraceae bacterium]
MKYQLAILGGGPAGYTAAEKASKAGMDVVLFEQNALGGTCLNVGCIPTKTLLYSAKQYYNATHADKYGVKAENVTFDYAKIVQRKQKVVRKLVAGIKQKLNNEHCTVVTGSAAVVSRTDEAVVMTCNGEQYEAENLLICTGSVNFVPPIPGVKDNPAVWDSTDALAATQLPQSMIIVGGGVIGMEFATLYHELGVPVTVIEAMPTILPNLDQEVVSILRDKYTKAGIKILTATKVMSLDGNKVCAETAEGEKLELEAEHVLISVGRRANMAGLEALSDLECNRGIVVDEFMHTNLANVYAAGDVTGKIMLAHVASRQAEVAVGRMLKEMPVQRIAYNAIPSVVYTNPEIASVGITEQEADCEVRKIPMTFSGRFVAENEGETGLVKVLVDKKNRTVLGVHMIGNPCSEFVAAASFAVRMGYTVPEFMQVVFPHPTVSEVLREAMI